MREQRSGVPSDALEAFLHALDTAVPTNQRQGALREPEPPQRRELLRLQKRYRQFRRALSTAVILLLVLWLPPLLERFAIYLPFYQDSPWHRGLCQGAVLFVLLLVSLPVWQEAAQQRSCGCIAPLITNVVVLFDAVLPFPGNKTAEPLCGVAAISLVLALWGCREQYRGFYESMHLISIGKPLYGVSAEEGRIVTGNCTTAEFYPHMVGEDTPAQWQRLLLPTVTAAAVALSLICSVGQWRWEQCLRYLAVMLCAATPLVAMFAYALPFGHLAKRLAKYGAVLAGQWGADTLARGEKIVVSDRDLFPDLRITNMRLYGEERNRALTYANSMAWQGGGCLAVAFQQYCSPDGILRQQVEYFHVHDEGGFSGILHGETVLLGNTGFLRRMGVKLPEGAENRTLIGLAVDSSLVALFLLEYQVSPKLRQLVQGLGGKRLTMAVVDGNVTPRLMKQLFGVTVGAYPEMCTRRALLQEERELSEPGGLLYRGGFAYMVELLLGSLRLCRMVRLGSLLLVLSQVSGLMLSGYLLYADSGGVLTPTMLLVFQLLWVLPMLPLLWGINRV